MKELGTSCIVSLAVIGGFTGLTAFGPEYASALTPRTPLLIITSKG